MKQKATVLLLLIAIVSSFVGNIVSAQDTLPSALVSADWLEENLEAENLRIIEVSVIPGVYERGHIPGAVNFVWHTDFVDAIQRDIISAEAFQELARNAGINQDTEVVLYGDNNNWFAAWGVWIFKIYGFENVRLLDGGRIKWEADGRVLSTDVASYEAGDFTVAAESNLELRALKDDVLSVVLGETAGSLVDIRGAAEYNGEIFAPDGVQELSIRAGHIPGAVNVTWTANVNEDGTFKSVDELRDLYANVGIDGSQQIYTYCRIGERAALTWFVLHELLGYEQVALYDGSWTEWGNSVGVPIENPAGTVWGGQ